SLLFDAVSDRLSKAAVDGVWTTATLRLGMFLDPMRQTHPNNPPTSPAGCQAGWSAADRTAEPAFVPRRSGISASSRVIAAFVAAVLAGVAGLALDVSEAAKSAGEWLYVLGLGGLAWVMGWRAISVRAERVVWGLLAVATALAAASW